MKKTLALLFVGMLLCAGCNSLEDLSVDSTLPVDSESGAGTSLVPSDFRAQETGAVALPRP